MEIFFAFLSGISLSVALMLAFMSAKFITDNYNFKDLPKWMNYILCFGIGAASGGFFLGIFGLIEML